MGKEVGLAYVCIGNSDDKLTQFEWSLFVADTRAVLRRHSVETHGEWFAAPDAEFQNACWCVAVLHTHRLDLQRDLARLAFRFRQDSIAYADVLFTTFIEPNVPDTAPLPASLPASDALEQAQTVELHPNCTQEDVAPGQQPDEG